jgi:hypothetical protein
MTEPHQSTSLILICTTSYDEVTCFMSRLLSDFSYTGKVVHHVQLERSDVSYTDVLAPYRAQQNRVILIFCGHGEEDALFTGLKQDCADLKEVWDEGVFYDSSYFDSGPDILAAFCCSAGKDLGSAFALENGGSFLGFCDKLWLIHTGSEECNSWWKKILSGFVVRVIDDENVDGQTLDFVRSLYAEAYDYFCSEEGQLAEEALGMRMCLRRNLLALCHY